jgi:PiT family inorganic phosphate transporter
MATSVSSLPAEDQAKAQQKSLLDRKMADSRAGRWGMLVFGIVLVCGVGYIAFKLIGDLALTHQATTFPYILLGLALLIALGFEFVNGFHDTANAVATVIYTHSLEPHIAVVWSGLWNFVVMLLPVELILKVSKGSGFSMVFALLIAAILWNLGTWWKGLPASSSHTMIGSVIGVGVMNQLMRGSGGTSGVDWDQVAKVFKALLFSPLIGFIGAFLLLLLARKVLRNPRLYKAPEGDAPPPFWIRGLLILTCTGVSFAHGSNDGQKGMGLIMLILVGTVPTAYALNHAVDQGDVTTFAAVSTQVTGVLEHYMDPNATVGESGPELERFVSQHTWEPSTMTRSAKW